jgi:hypothetical protein
MILIFYFCKINLKMLIQKQILLFIFNLFIASLLIGQTDQENLSDIERGELILKNLEKGVLLVKIPTGSNKINVINRLLTKDEGNAQLRKQYYDEIYRVAKIQRNLMLGFEEFYSFSPFIGVYDTNYIKVLKNPNLKGVFIDANLNVVKDYSLQGKTFATFREDQLFYNETSAHEGFTLSDNIGLVPNHPLGLGIPYKFKRHTVMPVGGIFSRADCSMEFFTRYNYKVLDRNPYYAIVKMLQIKLEIYGRYLQCRS